MEQNKFWTRLSLVSLILSFVLLMGTLWIWHENSSLKTEIQAFKTEKVDDNNSAQLQKDVTALKDEVKALKEKSVNTNANANAGSSSGASSRNVSDKTLYYLSKLNDKTFTTTYNHDYTWYIAAEELGKIGKEAIPLLVENLKTGDVYEKSLTFYALQLASQNDNVKAFTKGEYINVKSPLSFDDKQFDEMNKIVNDWWQKYKNNFN